MSYYPEGRMDLYAALAEHKIPITERCLDIAAGCDLCGLCDYQCYFVTEMRPSRVMAALKDLVAAHVQGGGPVRKAPEDPVAPRYPKDRRRGVGDERPGDRRHLFPRSGPADGGQAAGLRRSAQDKGGDIRAPEAPQHPKSPLGRPRQRLSERGPQPLRWRRHRPEQDERASFSTKRTGRSKRRPASRPSTSSARPPGAATASMSRNRRPWCAPT